MYRIENNRVAHAPKNTATISGFPLYLSSLPVSERQAQGWFARVIEDPAVSEPTPASDEDAIHVPVPAAPPPRSFAISKRRFHQAIAAAGRDTEFHAYLSTTPGAQDAWDDATVLMSNDPMIVAALPVLAAMLPDGMDVNAFLLSCESV